MSMKRCIGCGELHDGPHARCGECTKAYRHEYYEAHRKQIAEQAHRHYVTHRAQCIAANQRWAKANPERARAYKRAFYRRDYAANFEKYAERSRREYAAHREDKLAYTHRYYEAHKAEIAGRKRRYYLANRERILAACKEYRQGKKA